MKTLILACSSVFLAVPAVAADLVIPYADDLAPVSASQGDWTAFYLGVFGAYAGGTYTYQGNPTDPTFPYIGDAAGGAIGFQLGADYQVNSFVIGGVADLAWARLGAKATGGGIDVTPELQYLGTLRARVGVANETLLGYVHGGAAFGANTTSAHYTVGGAPLKEFKGGSRIGYTLGVGLEAKVTDKISVFGEYAYTNLGSLTVFSNPPAAPAFDLNESLAFHTVKLGLNYRF